MATKKKILKSHTSSRKKASKKAVPKAPNTTAKSARKKHVTLKRRKELNELASRMFQMVYDDYQQGKFHRIL